MVKFKYGTQSSYNKLVSSMLIDTDAIYCLTDSHRLYRGYDLIGNDAINISETVPDFLKAFHNKLYIVKPVGDTYHFYIKGALQMEEISFNQSIITSLDCFKNHTLIRREEGLQDNDEAVPTSATVYDAVESARSKWNILT